MLMTALARQVNLPIVINNMGSWGKAQQAVMSDKADVIYGLYQTPERLQWLSYVAVPIFTDSWGILVPKGKEFIYTDRRSLIGKRGVTMDGESFEAELDQWIASRLSVRRVPNQAAVLGALKQGNLDYAIVSLASAMGEAQRNKIQADFVLITDNFLKTNMYIAVSRESPCRKIVEGFSSTLGIWKNDGTLDQLLSQAIRQHDQMPP
jgi:polar amino acid transport system substrate-binding protein